MPRDSSGVYTVPAGTTAATKTLISSQAYNTFLTDIASAMTNSLNVQGTAAMQAVLNMGNFKISNMTDPASAQDAVTLNYLSNTFAPSAAKVNGWLGYTPANKAGDTFTGQVTVAPASAAGNIVLEKTALSGQSANVYGAYGATSRWGITLGDGTTEGGSNTGSNFGIVSFNDAGAAIGTVFSIVRATGAATFGYGLTISGGGLAVTGASNFATSLTAPTPASGDNSTNVATTAFVEAGVPTITAALAFGVPGSYAGASSGSAVIQPGSTVAGSTLLTYYSNTTTSGALSGTWRYMGSSNSNGAANGGAGQIYLRTI